MDIHFVSTLTPDDEERLASVLVETAKTLLSYFPISYTLRVSSTSDKVLEHTQNASIAPTVRPPRLRPVKVSAMRVVAGPGESDFSPDEE